jgi:hypothetical protein
MIATLQKTIAVGESVFEITCLDLRLERYLDRICAAFIVDQPAEYRVWIACAPAGDLKAEHVLRVDEFSCFLDRESKSAGIEFNITPSWEIFAAALAHLCMVVSLDKGAVLFHACAVVKNGRAYIFSGPSGAGKSTVARLSAPRAVMSQELIGISGKGKELFAFALPYAGDSEFSRRLSGRTKVAGMFKLVKDSVNAVRAMSRAQALAEFFILPEAVKADMTAEEYFGNYVRIVSAVDCYEMHFKLDNSFWRMIDGCAN